MVTSIYELWRHFQLNAGFSYISVCVCVCVCVCVSVWWEGMTDEPPERLLSWLRTEWSPGLGTEAANANARFTVS